MQIRPMTINDYDEVFAMWQITTKRALSKADERDQIERYLLRNAGMSQVAVVDGKIVGTVLAGHDGRRGFIHHMAVLPDYRRRHIGHRLAEKAIEMISRDGIDKTHIFCYQNNETGQNFWKDFGFEKRDDVFVFSYVNSKQTKEGIEQ
ncbi:MAG: GNAT family N-acetyltransferase [Ruminococcus sp.]|nr:GNAT family N-acetyltransferase [uncultured Ruminococcus sp.]MBQ1350175.1 GNAT family N-acetyltransferase [Ruminococcus sp.]SCX10281.1 Ribosomal protein S18 acetylase RimI [Ruminococcaceae bacterium P7]MBQ1616315.1 GNAT family N-acetyltransferase [Ruminococcus sp.]MBQ4170977.1 GNAT family N-acetyltransferase [Ruminococcus sp.]MBQ4261603.1 GNAT family N-acetyltransferase [Ruminococcus sp.]